MRRVLGIGMLIMMLLVYSVTGLQTCPTNCTCESNILNCDRKDAPEVIPIGTEEVYLEGFEFVPHGVRPFQDPSWQNVSKLDIITNYLSDNLFIAGNCFSGLTNLEIIGIHEIVAFNPQKTNNFTTFNNSLSGLDNLRTLDLSNNPSLSLDDALIMLTKISVVPKLQSIILNRLNALNSNSIPLNLTAFRIFAMRPIETLMFDETSLSIDMTDLGGLCKTLKILSFRKSTFELTHGAMNCACRNLTLLDLSNANIRYLESALRCLFTQDMFNNAHILQRFAIFLNVKQLNLNNVLKNGEINFHRKSNWDASGIVPSTRIIQLRGNRLHTIDIGMENMSFPENTEIDVSFNGLKYIHPRSVYPGTNIRKLDLSNNRLSLMESQYPHEYAIFLNIFADLEELNLSVNGLRSIPRNMFQVNMQLKSLDLSDNQLTAISFDLNNLRNLQNLNVSGNQFENFDDSQIGEINSLVATFAMSHNASVDIDFTNNNWQCCCSCLTFMKWIETSTFLTESNALYKCQFEDETLNIKVNAYDKTVTICDHRKMVRSSLIASGVCFIGLVVALTVVIILRRKQRKQKNIANAINLIREGNFGKKFLIFFSYASEDGDFAYEHVYPKLNKQLCENTGANRELVCIGEKHFRPGFNINDEIITSLDECVVMVCLVSRAYCGKAWCNTEIDEALMQKKPIVLIFREDVEENSMTPVMRKLFNRNIRSKVEVNDDGNCVAQPSWGVLCLAVIEMAAEHFKTSRKKELKEELETPQ